MGSWNQVRIMCTSYVWLHILQWCIGAGYHLTAACDTVAMCMLCANIIARVDTVVVAICSLVRQEQMRRGREDQAVDIHCLGLLHNPIATFCQLNFRRVSIVGTQVLQSAAATGQAGQEVVLK